jgi:hypothetical protein
MAQAPPACKGGGRRRTDGASAVSDGSAKAYRLTVAVVSCLIDELPDEAGASVRHLEEREMADVSRQVNVPPVIHQGARSA